MLENTRDFAKNNKKRAIKAFAKNKSQKLHTTLLAKKT
jgi:hypothetical protein